MVVDEFHNSADGYEDESQSKSKDPFFNMADASLERIHVILQQIAINSVRDDINDFAKQNKMINLVKSLLINSLPLAPDGFKEDFKNEVLAVQPNPMFKLAVKSGIQKRNLIFNWDLEKKLNNFVIEICLVLQKKGYFMPTKKKSLF